jgi:hypothetical protein
MNAIGAKNLSEIGDLYRNFDVIAVDEGQFFPDVSPNHSMIVPLTDPPLE